MDMATDVGPPGDINAYEVKVTQVKCIAESDVDQSTASDEVYFGFAVSDKHNKHEVNPPTDNDVVTGKVWHPNWSLWANSIDFPLAIHVQAWEEDNGRSPLRDDAGGLLRKISEFIREGLEAGKAFRTGQGKVEGMWENIANVADIIGMIIEGMDDDFIGENVAVVDKSAEGQYLWETTVRVGTTYQGKDNSGNLKTRSVEGCYDLTIGVEGYDWKRGKIHAGGNDAG